MITFTSNIQFTIRMARYLEPKNDWTFKRIFGEHPDVLIDFLNAQKLII